MFDLPITIAVVILTWVSYSLLSWTISRRLDGGNLSVEPSLLPAVAQTAFGIGLQVYGASGLEAAAYCRALWENAAFATLMAIANAVVLVIFYIILPRWLEQDAVDITLYASASLALLSAVVLATKVVTGSFGIPFVALAAVPQHLVVFQFVVFRIALGVVTFATILVVYLAPRGTIGVARAALNVILLFFTIFLVGTIYLKLQVPTYYSGMSRAFINDVRITSVTVLLAVLGILGRGAMATLSRFPLLLRRIAVLNATVLLLTTQFGALIAQSLFSHPDSVALFIAIVSAVVTAVVTVAAERWLKHGT
ncbi:MAG: hypothetical protein QOK37_869 [Thermoanaerobaculia bacterium]|jgi:hypothetical protein|nr:hypothetical protein [Thermoanaerobaculia bacterium]